MTLAQRDEYHIDDMTALELALQNLAAITAERDTLLADKARLDWLIENLSSFQVFKDGRWRTIAIFSREEIDEARKQHP